MLLCLVFFFFKQKTAYEMRISDWSSDVCSSDLSLAKHVANLCRTEVDFADGSLAKVSSGDGRLEIGEVGRRREVRRLGKIRRFGEIAPRPNYFGNGRECFAQRRREASDRKSVV